jgi:hypothetical protein
MAHLITTLLAQVKILAFEETGEYQELTDAEIMQQIRAAVNRYSLDFPDTQTDDVTGDGGKYYPVGTSLASWSEGFSRIIAIEYPAATIASDEAPQYLEGGDWRDDYWLAVLGVQTRYLYLPNHTPAATETMRITYTIPYGWAVSTTSISVSQAAHGFSVNDYIHKNADNVWVEVDAQLATHRVATVPGTTSFTAYVLQTEPPPAHFYALCHLAACLVCQAIAVKYSRIGDSAVLVDSTAHVTKAQEFANRASTFCKMYAEMMGIAGADGAAGGTMPAASAFANWDTVPRYPTGRQYHYHRNR